DVDLLPHAHFALHSLLTGLILVIPALLHRIWRVAKARLSFTNEEEPSWRVAHRG
ncbi:hypothetical protein HPP92_029026, partial [Vanilla planifolia]